MPLGCLFAVRLGSRITGEAFNVSSKKRSPGEAKHADAEREPSMLLLSSSLQHSPGERV